MSSPTVRTWSSRVTVALAVAGAFAWLTVFSGRLAWPLARRGLLPDVLLFATWPRGWMLGVRVTAGLVGFVLAVVVATRLTDRWWPRAATVVASLLILLAMPPVVMAYPGARVVFDTWRPAMVRAVELAAADPEPYVYPGYRLPASLAPVSSTGTVDGGDGVFFIPQWTGIPDDAGGYWYTEEGGPEGFDMFGMECDEPLALDEHWWSCGMPIEPSGDWTWAWF